MTTEAAGPAHGAAFGKTAPGGRHRWRLRAVDRAAAALGDGAYPPLVRHLLWGRGVRTGAQARRFLDEVVGPSASAEQDPFLLPDMERAVARLRRAQSDGELVAAFGDFDVDGITSCALLVQGLAALGLRVVPYIPDRFREGYGLNKGALAELSSTGVSLVLTADCGTSNVDEIAYARELGMDVIVIDHHTVPPELPAAVALVNPKRPDSNYRDSELAACGVSFKLLQATYEAMGRQFAEEDYIDLVALGTVVDMAPLSGENRDLVRRGLTALSRTSRPGLLALMGVAGVSPDLVSARDLGFGLGPRLNAAGRLSHAREALELILEPDPRRAASVAAALDELNLERRRQTEAAVTLARDLVAQAPAGAPLTFVGHESISAGIVGLVAGRLAEELHRPAVVYQEGETASRASARSIAAFDIAAALRRHASLMERFGGHRQAAGFTVTNDKREALRRGLEETAAEWLTEDDLQPRLDIDAALPLSALGGDEIRWISRFAPFGIGNPELTFLSRGVTVAECRPVGEGGGHLRLKLRDGAVAWPAIGFRLADLAPAPGTKADVVYTLTPDRLRGGTLELQVKDLAPARPA